MSFSVSILKNPVFVWNDKLKCEVPSWNKDQGDRNLDFIFNGKDFDALQTFLNVQLSSADPCKDENFGDYQDREKNEYLKAAKEKGYGMLGRFWFFYDDAIYFPSEVIQLQEECLKIKNKSKNFDLIKAIDKILLACKEALNTKSGIYFGCD